MNVSSATVSDISINNTTISTSDNLQIGNTGDEILLQGNITSDSSPITLQYILDNTSSNWTDKTLIDPIFGSGSSSLAFNASACNNTTITIPIAGTNNTILTTSDNPTFTNKTLVSSSNTLSASSLKFGTNIVNITGTASTSNLIASSASAASWATPDHTNLPDAGVLTHAQLDTTYNKCSVKGDMLIGGTSTLNKLSAGTDGNLLMVQSDGSINYTAMNKYSIINFNGDSGYILQKWNGCVLVFTLTGNASVRVSSGSDIQTGSKFYIINTTPQYQLFLLPDSGITIEASGAPKYPLGKFNMLYKSDTAKWSLHSMRNDISNTSINYTTLTLTNNIDASVVPSKLEALTINLNTILIIYTSVSGDIIGILYNNINKSFISENVIISRASSSDIWFKTMVLSSTLIGIFFLKNGTFYFYTSSNGSTWNINTIATGMLISSTGYIISEPIMMSSGLPGISVLNSSSNVTFYSANDTTWSTWSAYSLNTGISAAATRSLHLVYDFNTLYSIVHINDGKLYFYSANYNVTTWYGPASSTVPLTEPCRYSSIRNTVINSAAYLLCTDSTGNISYLIFSAVDQAWYVAYTYPQYMCTYSGFLNPPVVLNNIMWLIMTVDATLGKSADNIVLISDHFGSDVPNIRYDIFNTNALAGTSTTTYKTAIMYHINRYFAFKMAHNTNTLTICEHVNLI